MPDPLTSPPRGRDHASSPLTRIFAVAEARWAAAAVALFLVALPLNLLGASAWTWGPLFCGDLRPGRLGAGAGRA